MTAHPDEPAFLDDEGPSADLPPVPTTTNIRELYGWQPGESLNEAIARHQAEQAAKVHSLTVGERAALRQDMAESSEWMRAELARRQAARDQAGSETASHVSPPSEGT
ncbi:MAG: hypothetical protein RBS28_10130 [Rhodocyclaceae bacterium]|jgi:hypothetical protein|nr:hypothetical protein [Rhodocyclaceae bacterium]